MSDYRRGQEDLIKQIKIKISRILDTTEGYDMLFDIINLLKTLKPLRDEKTQDNDSGRQSDSN